MPFKPLAAGLTKSSVGYGLALAAGALALQWLDYRHAVRLFPTEIYIVVLAIGFTGLGVWLGTRLTRPKSPARFNVNARAIETLGLTNKELAVLARLAAGDSNAEIAQGLFVSTSTVKTHLLHLYQKLDVSRRTQAVRKAQSLQIIPFDP